MENLYQVVFNTVNEAIFLINQNHIIDCNQAALRLFDQTQADLFNQPWLDTITVNQPDLAAVRRLWLTKLNEAEQHGVCSFEWSHYLDINHVLQTHVVVKRHELRGRLFFQVSFFETITTETLSTQGVLDLEEIVARKEAEITQKRLTSIVEKVPDWVSLTDVDGNILYINPAGRQMLGIAADAPTTGLNIFARMAEPFRGQIIETALPAAFWDGVWTGDTALLTPTGQAVPMSVMIVVHERAEGDVEALGVLMRDISEVKVAQAEQERLLMELEETYRRYIRQEWDKFLASRQNMDILYESLTPNKQLSVETTDRVSFTLPLSLQGETIGELVMEDNDAQRTWTADEIAIVEVVSEQLALKLDNLRLLDSTQRSAWRDQLIREVTSQLWATNQLEEVMQAAVIQLGSKLNAEEVIIQLDPTMMVFDEHVEETIHDNRPNPT